MRVALVTFEFPPKTAYGGIASYFDEVSQMLAKNGHDLEVFCASDQASSFESLPNLKVNQVAEMDKDRFGQAALERFQERHAETPFDIIESPELMGDAYEIKQAFPEVPLAVKVHTPTFLLQRLRFHRQTLPEKLRFFAGGLKRGKLTWLRENTAIPELRNERERWLYRNADAVSSPSKDLIRIIEEEWGKVDGGISHLPNPMSPTPEMLQIDGGLDSDRLLNLGRLELRKGTDQLITALEKLHSRGRKVVCDFVGHPTVSPRKEMDMKTWAKEVVQIGDECVFHGNIPRDQVANAIQKCSIVILPSRWENFPYTCLETMASSRVVIGSKWGGMADAIEDSVNGFLVDPHSIDDLVEKIEFALELPLEERMEIAKQARQSILDRYVPEVILPQHLDFYEAAIQRRNA